MKSGLVSALVGMSCVLFVEVEMLEALRVKLSSEADAVIVSPKEVQK